MEKNRWLRYQGHNNETNDLELTFWMYLKSICNYKLVHISFGMSWHETLVLFNTFHSQRFSLSFIYLMRMKKRKKMNLNNITLLVTNCQLYGKLFKLVESNGTFGWELINFNIQITGIWLEKKLFLHMRQKILLLTVLPPQGPKFDSTNFRLCQSMYHLLQMF